jgi:hypothetical protein
MKNLMKLSIVILVITLSTESFSQTFVVKAGFNLSKMFTKDDAGNNNNGIKMKPGFQAGATGEFPVTAMLSFETGLLLSTKGFKMNEKETIMGEAWEVKGKINLYYLDIPLTAKASFDVGGAKIFGVFGPYLGMGLIGKTKSELTVGGETETSKDDVEWGSGDNDMLKRLDFGLIAGAGIELNAIQIGLNYGLGLANISSYTDEGTKIKNRVIGISVGYIFGRK